MVSPVEIHRNLFWGVKAVVSLFVFGLFAGFLYSNWEVNTAKLDAGFLKKSINILFRLHFLALQTLGLIRQLHLMPGSLPCTLALGGLQFGLHVGLSPALPYHRCSFFHCQH